MTLNITESTNSLKKNTWPDGWTGKEQVGDIMTDEVLAEGVVQPLLGDIFNA